MLAEMSRTIERGSVFPVRSERPSPLSSPLLGLWLAFAAALLACAAGVLAGEIPIVQAGISLLLLAAVIRMTASALHVPAQPVPAASCPVMWLMTASAITATPAPSHRATMSANSARVPSRDSIA